MNAFSTRSHLAVALYEAGMKEKDAIAVANAQWASYENTTRENLKQLAESHRKHARRLDAEIFVIEQVLTGMTPAKFPAVSTESGFAQAHHACIERAEKRDETQGVKG